MCLHKKTSFSVCSRTRIRKRKHTGRRLLLTHLYIYTCRVILTRPSSLLLYLSFRFSLLSCILKLDTTQLCTKKLNLGILFLDSRKKRRQILVEHWTGHYFIFSYFKNVCLFSLSFSFFYSRVIHARLSSLQSEKGENERR